MNKKVQYTIAIITARGGSKGLPGKNIIDLGGKPLLTYTIAAALESRNIDRVILSTDDQDIVEIGKKYGAEVPFLRPSSLATDTAHSPDVVEHAIGFLEESEGIYCDIAVMLQPTSPFRTGGHIDEAMEKYRSEDNESLISIKPQDYPPWWMFKTIGRQLKPAVPWKEGVNVFNLERQEFPEIYRPNGAIYITNRNQLKKKGNLVNPDSCGYYEMSIEDSVDIDNFTDLAVARTLFPVWQEKHSV
jgi:CMP-N,N'-diacetyllegionaminic acid synthase